jgi:hypothetical protein
MHVKWAIFKKKIFIVIKPVRGFVAVRKQFYNIQLYNGQSLEQTDIKVPGYFNNFGGLPSLK